MKNQITRRDFGKLGAAAGLTYSFISRLAPAAPQNYASNKVIAAVAGVRSRGKYLASKFASIPNCRVKYVIDVDSRYLPDAAAAVEKAQGSIPEQIKDFRSALDDKEVDLLVIASPDHWHAPMGIAALAAGKHVYVEKPCSHNPAEGEMFIAAQKKYGGIVQMGNQRRSFKIVEQMIDEIHGGVIGDVYYAKTWYSNKRGPIGYGKKVDVPAYLDWNLWQGPAPRTDYRDNIHPYNWHWFWNWGTGESLNNASHELDVARWALKVDYPKRVNSTAGRIHYPNQDDWQFWDTQNIAIQYKDDRMITWEGLSGSQYKTYDRETRGVAFFGDKGVIEYYSNRYKILDLDGKLIREEAPGKKSDTSSTNTIDPGLNDYHAENLINAIIGKGKVNSPIDEGHKSILLGHLANISAKLNTTLECDPASGHIINNAKAIKMWSREYEPGWEPKF
ncbi:Inositol 2-dehydrogenase [Limihaloglobus sulfuriphilus]|uniref:Inositol 2-dehydrogenase n=1 Tax=Limihaloglobus sulfuriphilus TaxID=1851148 RepID=A0A1Q2MIY5_9BACT|nr:Gfo/Idh/MocA family oxidoreductase [Limihaloglobus sulfuriphilus]AQQ72538.1 Inositol 2-dehydrogenase [Limihaloglobus sulfuriphilus]